MIRICTPTAHMRAPALVIAAHPDHHCQILLARTSCCGDDAVWDNAVAHLELVDVQLCSRIYSFAGTLFLLHQNQNLNQRHIQHGRQGDQDRNGRDVSIFMNETGLGVNIPVVPTRQVLQAPSQAATQQLVDLLVAAGQQAQQIEEMRKAS